MCLGHGLGHSQKLGLDTWLGHSWSLNVVLLADVEPGVILEFGDLQSRLAAPPDIFGGRRLVRGSAAKPGNISARDGIRRISSKFGRYCRELVQFGRLGARSIDVG